ncbi:MAG TPA: tetratricopeptide repeat protein [Gemmatimonadales bacterium]
MRLSSGSRPTESRKVLALRRAERINRQGLRNKAEGRHAEARRNYRRALRLVRTWAPDDRDALAVLHHNLGGIEYVAGNWAAGEAWARAGLAIRLAGPAEPGRVACDLIALAAIIDCQRRHDEAEALYLAGLRLLRNAVRPDAFELGVALDGLGVQYARRGHPDAAVRLLERAAHLKRSVLVRGHPSLTLTETNLARARTLAGG